MTTTAAVNSGAINEVGFPGSEQGASLVELVGNVVVATALSSVFVLSTVSASTVGSADASAGAPALRSNLSASASAGAGVSCDAQKIIHVSADSVVAKAQASATAAKVSNLGASSQAIVSSTADAVIEIARGASTTGAASASAFAVREISLASSASAVASCSAGVLQRVFLGATASGGASTNVDESLGLLTGASTSGTASGFAEEDVTVVHWVGAETTASAIGSAASVRERTASAIQSASAVIHNPEPSLLIAAAPVLQPASAKASASSYPKALRSATTTAQAPGSSNVKAIFSLSAEITPSALGASGITLRNYVIPVDAAARATASDIDVLMLRQSSGSVMAKATGTASMVFTMLTGATTTAQATCQSAAADYAVTARAPEERRMSLQSSNRRMEVLP